MAVTLHDISKLAGVDVGSVSRTLRGHPRAASLRPETRARVLAAAKQLGYRRDELAAAMRTGDNRAVAVICRYEDASPTYDANLIISGILGEATRLNYELKLYSDKDLALCFDKIVGARIPRVVSLSSDRGKREETAAFCRDRGVKLIYVYETAHGEFPAVATDNEKSARDSVMYLAEKGHRRIALVCGPHQFNYVNEHHNGYLRGLRDAGLTPREDLIVCGEDIDARVRAIGKMLALPVAIRPTAFYCLGDLLAMLTQRVAIKNGLRIPEDVSMMGYSDTIFSSAAFCPLTSVAQPFAQMGEVALRVLLGEDVELAPTAEGRYLLPTRLVPRESVMDLTLGAPADRVGAFAN